MVIELTSAQAGVIHHPCAPDRETILEVKRRLDLGETNKQIQTDVYVGSRVITKVRQGGYII